MRFEIVEIASVIMLCISFYGLTVSRNIIKSIVLTVLMESSVIMFFLGIGFRLQQGGMIPPIGAELVHMESLTYVADPLPQALMITAIVIGLSVTAVNIIMLLNLLRKFNTADWDTVKTKSMEACN